MILRLVAALLVSLLMLPASVSGQDSIRDTYIKHFSNHFFVWPVIKKRELSFQAVSFLDKKKEFSFKPNNSYSLGLGINIFEITLEASFSVPVDIKSQERYGASDVRDFQAVVLGKKWLAEVYTQKYKGFYFTTSDLVVPPDQSYPQRADLATRNFGFSFAYIFNNQKFSLRSAYNFTERQKSSRGSFLLSYVVSSFNFSSDSALISKDNWLVYGAGSSTEDARFTSLGLAPGYSYNFVVDKFFLNTTLVLGPAHYWVRYNSQEGQIKNDISINFYSAVRLGLGYNGDRFFAGINIVAQGRNVRIEQVDFKNTISTLRFVAGFRFPEKGLLKKRAVDYLPVRKSSLP